MNILNSGTLGGGDRSVVTRKKQDTEELTSRQKLIHSAERLFAAEGFDRVSVRDIAGDAQVNSALVGYYFGSKEGLLAEVYTRHCEPLKRERMRLLAECSPGGVPASLEGVLDAFIRPSLAAGQNLDDRSFSRLRAILSAENSSLLEQLVASNFDDTTRAFVKALSKCLPELDRQDVFWRFHFLLGAIYYTATGPHRIKTLSKGKCDPANPEATAEQLVRFAAAGFRAPGNSSKTRAPRARKKRRRLAVTAG